MSHPLRVTIWNEYIHELQSTAVGAIYPEGMHAVWSQAIAEHLGDGVQIRVATLDQEEHGLTYETLSETDVGGGINAMQMMLGNAAAPQGT